MKKVQPLVSIIMPTLNSAKSISLSLESVNRQTYPKKYIEILVVDGGSKDETLNIAQKYGAKVISNPKVQPEHAKSLGLINAKGEYAMFLDSDEVLENSHSIENRINLFKENLLCKNIVTTGLVCPKGLPFITEYVNRIGDPFSFFVYQIDGGNFYKSLSSKYQTEKQTKQYRVFLFNNKDQKPIVDGGGHFFDLNYLKSITSVQDLSLPARVFSLMSKSSRRLGVLSDDYVLHYSTANIKNYLSKINFRIISNLSTGNTNIAGFSNREKDSGNTSKYNKYIFLPYAFTIVFPLINSVNLSIKNKDSRFMIHFPLTIYTAASILYFIVKIKLLGLSQSAGIYGSVK